MSNRRKLREFQPGSGRLTRPRGQWHGHARGRVSSARAADMNAASSLLMRALSLVPGSGLRLPRKV